MTHTRTLTFGIAAFTLAFFANACQNSNADKDAKSGLASLSIQNLQNDGYDQYVFGMVPRGSAGIAIAQKTYSRGPQSIEQTVVPGQYEIKLDYLKAGVAVFSADFCTNPKADEDNVKDLKAGKNSLKIAVCSKSGQPVSAEVEIIPVISTNGGATEGALPKPTPTPTAPAGNAALTAACTKNFSFQAQEEASVAIFKTHFADPLATVKDAALRVCMRLYKQAAEVPTKTKVILTIKRTTDAGDVAYTVGGSDSGEVTINSEYIKRVAADRNAADAKKELLGVLIHEMTHVYQKSSPGIGWLIEGVADFVRLREGLVDASNRRKGGNYTDAYNTTAFFFDYLDKKFPDFSYKLNLAAAKYPAGNQAFVQITGKDVDTLWREYQASF